MHAKKEGVVDKKLLTKEQVDVGVNIISSRPISFLQSSTGSGKTTLIPPKLSEKQEGKRIGVGMPTIYSVQNAVKRVKGSDSRYRGKSANPKTFLVYMTFGMLLKDYLKNNIPWDYVIIDEAHTGSAEISLIISLHLNLPENKRPKICFMTATPVTFKKLENIKPVLLKADYIFDERKDKVVFLEKPVELKFLYKETANVVKNILDRNPKGNILVFVPGRREARLVKSSLNTKKA